MPHYPEYLYPWQSSKPVPPVPPQPVPAHTGIPGHHSDLRQLRSAYRRLRRVATLTALGYFTLFLILSGYAPGLMGSELPGGLNTGLLLGLCQLPVTLVAITVYEKSARRRVDPLSENLRNQASRGAAR
ncbi:DUF485 domain-containing protein [Streptomyces sp. ISL-98]|uniref:DUF485 domain-containing protein n=1 Tax=Streptomyces sp. ISL-98 TaxID=2819192 RepID=UPI001BEA6D83|nr:DUF485 domain-containing protein [Streptomyces sp. ISL-98]MBT2505594.1 DUF485 domain-containing protein [Streptomyces sp. ISL-98]